MINVAPDISFNGHTTPKNSSGFMNDASSQYITLVLIPRSVYERVSRPHFFCGKQTREKKPKEGVSGDMMMILFFLIMRCYIYDVYFH